MRLFLVCAFTVMTLFNFPLFCASKKRDRKTFDSGLQQQRYPYIIKYSGYYAKLQQKNSKQSKGKSGVLPGFFEIAKQLLCNVEQEISNGKKTTPIPADEDLALVLYKTERMLRLFDKKKKQMLSAKIAKIPFKKSTNSSTVVALQFLKLAYGFEFPWLFARNLAEPFVDELGLVHNFARHMNKKESVEDLKLVAALLGQGKKIDEAAFKVPISPQVSKTLIQHWGATKSLSFHQQGVVVVLPFYESSVPLVMDLNSGKSHKLFGRDEEVNCVDISLDGTMILTSSTAGGWIYLWDTQSSFANGWIDYFGGAKPCYAKFDPQGANIAAMLSDGSISIVDVASQKERFSLGKIAKGIDSFCFSSDGEELLITTANGAVHLQGMCGGWSKILVKKAAKAFAAQFNADGTKVIASSPDPKLSNAAVVIDLEKNKSYALVGHTQKIVFARFSPKGTYAVTASKDGTIRIWDAASCALKHVLDNYQTLVDDWAFSSDEKYLATVSGKAIRLWDLATGGEVHRLVPTYADGKILRVQFSPDGKKLISLWRDASSWRFLEWDLCPLVTPEEELVCTAFKTWAKESKCKYPCVTNLQKGAYITQVIERINYRFDESFPAIPTEK